MPYFEETFFIVPTLCRDGSIIGMPGAGWCDDMLTAPALFLPLAKAFFPLYTPIYIVCPHRAAMRYAGRIVSDLATPKSVRQELFLSLEKLVGIPLFFRRRQTANFLNNTWKDGPVDSYRRAFTSAAGSPLFNDELS